MSSCKSPDVISNDGYVTLLAGRTSVRTMRSADQLLTRFGLDRDPASFGAQALRVLQTGENVFVSTDESRIEALAPIDRNSGISAGVVPKGQRESLPPD